MVDFGDYTNFLRPPPPLVCKLMQLTKAFLTGNHSEDRSRKGRKEGRKEGQEIGNLKMLLRDL